MITLQKNFFTATEAVDEQRFYQLVRDEQSKALIDGFRQSGDASLKRKLPAFIFQATFDETTSKKGKPGRWRKQAATRLNGLVVMDIDHVDNPQELFEKWKQLDFDKLGILFIYITPSGKGLKIVFKANILWGNLIDNQLKMAEIMGVKVDESCKDASRMSFVCKEEDILYLNKELFTYEDAAFAEKYNGEYRAGHSAATTAKTDAKVSEIREVKAPLCYHGVPYATIIEAWLGGKKVVPGDRHRTSLCLADHLRYITDNDPRLIEAILRQTPFVAEIVEERNEDVAGTVRSAMEYKMYKNMPKKMLEALEKAGAIVSDEATEGADGQRSLSNMGEEDIYAQLPLGKWAEELQELSDYFPCMKELFINLHPHKLPAVLFSAGAMFGTLMTRAWYHFWYDPEIMRRLNYSIFVIGDPGSGKNVIEKFYYKILEPVIQADKVLIDAVNRYKEGRTERTTSTKAQKGDALKRPVVGIRVHPARTATGEFIRHMNAAVETIMGQSLHLHMFSFDAELDNVTKNNKGGDWKDREVLELKAFHNEQDGQMYANQESVTGMFNVFWNFIYTGTPYALHRKVNQRNYGTGMSTRLAVIPLPDTGMAERHQKVDMEANDTLKEWAFRLDKVEGELPIEPLNDETFEWQSNRMEIARFNGDKADRSLLKRIPYYGIAISLPFIMMRHWNEWQESKTITMDDIDKRLCRMVMEMQYRCQQFFFGEMAFNYYEDQNKEFVVRKRTQKYDTCFSKLPEEFTAKQLMDCFGIEKSSANRTISRFIDDGVVENVRYSVYRKLVKELP
ncbi:MAG: hypothetical protein IJ534_02960 [Bacteroidaceae bacterium]|nr:hypothetical protein [Bacteroidaceae bacterium]